MAGASLRSWQSGLGRRRQEQRVVLKTEGDRTHPPGRGRRSPETSPPGRSDGGSSGSSPDAGLCRAAGAGERLPQRRRRGIARAPPGASVSTRRAVCCNDPRAGQTAALPARLCSRRRRGRSGRRLCRLCVWDVVLKGRRVLGREDAWHLDWGGVRGRPGSGRRERQQVYVCPRFTVCAAVK